MNIYVEECEYGFDAHTFARLQPRRLLQLVDGGSRQVVDKLQRVMNASARVLTHTCTTWGCWLGYTMLSRTGLTLQSAFSVSSA